jgi:predicted phosphohydrolase
MTRLWVLSDVHCDFPAEPWIVPQGVEADAIVIAGDYRNGLRNAIRAVASDYASYLRDGVPLIYVPGNHCYWNCGLQHELEAAQPLALDLGVALLASGETTEVDGVRIVGATLWTDMLIAGNGYSDLLVVQDTMLDFRKIRDGNFRKIRASQIVAEHAKHRAAIESVLRVPHAGKTVVVTHHAPSALGLRYGKVTEALDAAFASDLDAMIEVFRPELWIHGHVHCTRRYAVSGTSIVVNARGYVESSRRPGTALVRENPDFDQRLVVEV